MAKDFHNIVFSCSASTDLAALATGNDTKGSSAIIDFGLPEKSIYAINIIAESKYYIDHAAD